MRITIDKPKRHKYTLYNNDTIWEPVEVVGNTMVYNMQTTGAFNLLDEKRKLVFYLYNDSAQDFFINTINAFNEENPDEPGEVIATGSYMQYANIGYNTHRKIWVNSKGRDLSTLQLTGHNISVRKIDQDKGNTWVLMDMHAIGETARPSYVKIGDVMVMYCQRFN